MLTIGWFSTGRDEAARQLLRVVHDNIHSGEIKGNIIFVFSNRESGESKESDLFFDLVHSYNIPLICLSSQKFRATQGVATTANQGTLPRWRLEYDREVIRRLRNFTPAICVLAGYMLIVGDEMCHKYNMINLHPAAPAGPKGSWQEVIWTLMENRARESGAMMHLVTSELDRGPVVTYCTYPISGEPFDRVWQEIENCSIAELKKGQGENNRLFQLIRQNGLVREFPLIVSTLRAFSQNEIRIDNGKIFSSRGKPITGYNLTEEINMAIKSQ